MTCTHEFRPGAENKSSERDGKNETPEHLLCHRGHNQMVYDISLIFKSGKLLRLLRGDHLDQPRWLHLMLHPAAN